jgi:hypothetical protein
MPATILSGRKEVVFEVVPAAADTHPDLALITNINARLHSDSFQFLQAYMHTDAASD